MKCPSCSSLTKVLESREIGDCTTVRRRRECKKCDYRFTTYERPEMRMRVVKRDSTREKFDQGKIKNGVLKACEKRPVSEDDIESLIENVLSEIRKMGVNEIKSTEIGRMVMDRLKELDKVAYIRFASVYKSFDLDSLEKEIKAIKR